MPDLIVAPTLPGWVAAVAAVAVDGAPADVAVRVRRHGVRRAFFTACEDRSCRLVVTPETYAEGSVAGRGHLYARRRDLAACRSGAPVVPVDRTRHWVTGRAYDGVPVPRAVPRGTRYVVTAKVPQVVPDGLLPAERTYHRAKRAGAATVATPADDLVLVLAHELRHVQQFRHGLPRSEVDAERAGQAALRDWVAAGRPGWPPDGAGGALSPPGRAATGG